MTKKLILSILCLIALACTYSCNSKENISYDYDESTSVLVSAFSLQANSKVLDSLQNVFFAIDQVTGDIFNADSLPYGTRINRLIPKITAPAYAQAVQLECPRPGATDSIMNYLTNATDSVDFSNGPVKLRVTSQSGTAEKVYTIKVNVHKTKPDTLAWARMEQSLIPADFAVVAEQGIVYNHEQEAFYCLSWDGKGNESNHYEISSCHDIENGLWVTNNAIVNRPMQASSIVLVEDKAYGLDIDGILCWASATELSQFTPTAETWSHIYGAYGDQVLGCYQDGEDWKIASYPDGLTWDLPIGMPVSGTSQTVIYQVQMGESPMMVMFGGRAADGTLSSSAWGFDGTDWAEISRQGVSEALEDVCLISYDIFKVPSSTWKPVQCPALIAIGGRNAQGSVNRTVYLSLDWGMTWKEAPELMQMPADIPVLYGSKAFVIATTMHAQGAQMPASRSCCWTNVNVTPLYPHCSWELPMSRATQPIEEWQCPYIYLFGGHMGNGAYVPNYWRGVILRYTFEPKY